MRNFHQYVELNEQLFLIQFMLKKELKTKK